MDVKAEVAVTLTGAVATVLFGCMASELADWAPRLAERLLRWGARTFGTPDKTLRYEEEWLGNLGEVPAKLSKLIWACGIIVRAVPEMRRDFSRAADGLVADCRAGKLDSRALAERYLELADAGGQSRGGRRLASALLAAAVESLGADLAADLAWHLADLGLKGPAFGFTWQWLRLERICDRRPADAAVFLRVLAGRQPGDRREVELLISDAVSQWSCESRQKVQELLRPAR